MRTRFIMSIIISEDTEKSCTTAMIYRTRKAKRPHGKR